MPQHTPQHRAARSMLKMRQRKMPKGLDDLISAAIKEARMGGPPSNIRAMVQGMDLGGQDRNVRPQAERSRSGAAHRPATIAQDVTRVDPASTVPREPDNDIFNAFMEALGDAGELAGRGARAVGNFLIEPLEQAAEGGQDVFEEVLRQRRQLRDPFGG